jgi:hypothetical protein
MGDFLNYAYRLEAMAFFSAYPLVFLLFKYLVDTPRIRSTKWPGVLHTAPGVAYALTGTLFLGLLIRDSNLQMSFIRIWGLSSLLFWVPVLNKRPWLAFIHSFLFFFIILKDLIEQVTGNPSPELLQNDMRVFTDSLLLNSAVMVIVSGFHIIYRQWRRA